VWGGGRGARIDQLLSDQECKFVEKQICVM
jgi:hypothetical protein